MPCVGLREPDACPCPPAPLPAPCQVWQPRQAQVQCRSNKGQTMPKKMQYVQGLRGAPDVKMNVIRLELELGQPHQH